MYDTVDKAAKEIAVLKGYLRSGRLRALYPWMRVLSRDDNAEDSRKRFTVVRPNMGSREPTIEGGAGTSQLNGNGYDKLYVDDICPPTVATQPAVREDINYRFTHEHEKRLRDPRTASITMICTPWAVDDVAGRIVEQVRNGERAGWRVAIDEFRVRDGPDGLPVSLWPERFSPHFYLAEKRKDPRAYARLYELNPQPQESRIVRFVRFYPCNPADPAFASLPAEKREFYLKRLDQIARSEQWLSIDPSATSGRHSSETACSQIAITADGHAYVVRVDFFRDSPVTVQDWLVRRIMRGDIRFVLMEAQAGMTGQVALWTEYIYRRLRELGHKWDGNIIRMGTRGADGAGQNVSKAARLKNTAALIEGGYIKFPGRLKRVEESGTLDMECCEDPSAQKLVSQILNFPMGLTDGMDTITQWLLRNEDRLQAEGAGKSASPRGAFEPPCGSSAAAKKMLAAMLRPPSEDREHEFLQEIGIWN